MKKLFTILTTFIVIVLITHMIYMLLAIMNLIPYNQDFAQNLGYILMYSAVLHGIYGIFKWIYSMVSKRKLSKLTNSKSQSKLTRSERRTMLQRILGLITIAIIVPHGYIRLMTADAFPLIADILYMIALLAHLWIGFPKLIVSLGLRRSNTANGGNK